MTIPRKKKRWGDVERLFTPHTITVLEQICTTEKKETIYRKGSTKRKVKKQRSSKVTTIVEKGQLCDAQYKELLEEIASRYGAKLV